MSNAFACVFLYGERYLESKSKNSSEIDQVQRDKPVSATPNDMIITPSPDIELSPLALIFNDF